MRKHIQLHRLVDDLPHLLLEVKDRTRAIEVANISVEMVSRVLNNILEPSFEVVRLAVEVTVEVEVIEAISMQL